MTSKSLQTGPRWLCLWLLASLVGCAGNGGTEEPRFAIEGKVTADGTPLEHGTVVFIPQGATKGPRVVARVDEGEFQVDRFQGPCAGEFRIEVNATTPDVQAMQEGRRVQEISPAEWQAFRDVQEEFNTRSTMTATVSADSPNTFEFQVRRMAK